MTKFLKLLNIKEVKKIIFIIILIVILGILGLIGWRYVNNKELSAVSNFDECVAKGNPITESYPRQCKTPNGKTFTEDIGNAIEKADLIRVENPRPNQLIGDSLVIKGEARGFWFFEASFPIKLVDANNNEIPIAPAFAVALGEWMTENFVPFQATIEFETPSTQKGTLILKKDNPSGLPENDDELIIPVKFFQGITY